MEHGLPPRDDASCNKLHPESPLAQPRFAALLAPHTWAIPSIIHEPHALQHYTLSDGVNPVDLG